MATVRDRVRAFNYAIDRSKAVADFGGTEQAAVTCQILPAGITGYRPDCPYTRHQTSNALWTGPNLTRAKELVRASGTFGDKVVFWAPARPIARAFGRLAVATLKRLGYQASLKIVARANTPPTAHKYYFEKIQDSRTKHQHHSKASTVGSVASSSRTAPWAGVKHGP